MRRGGAQRCLPRAGTEGPLRAGRGTGTQRVTSEHAGDTDPAPRRARAPRRAPGLPQRSGAGPDSPPLSPPTRTSAPRRGTAVWIPPLPQRSAARPNRIMAPLGRLRSSPSSEGWARATAPLRRSPAPSERGRAQSALSPAPPLCCRPLRLRGARCFCSHHGATGVRGGRRYDQGTRATPRRGRRGTNRRRKRVNYERPMARSAVSAGAARSFVPWPCAAAWRRLPKLRGLWPRVFGSVKWLTLVNWIAYKRVP